jgi:hypothetical protein
MLHRVAAINCHARIAIEPHVVTYWGALLDRMPALEIRQRLSGLIRRIDGTRIPDAGEDPFRFA